MVGGNGFDDGAQGFFPKALKKRRAADGVVNAGLSPLQYLLKDRAVLAEIVEQPAQPRRNFRPKGLSICLGKGFHPLQMFPDGFLCAILLRGFCVIYQENSSFSICYSDEI